MRWHALIVSLALLVSPSAHAQEPPRDPSVLVRPSPPNTPPSVAAPTQTPRPALPLLPPDAPRLALVIGQGAYQAGPLATAVNDAGLVAEALRGAGFDLTQGADLDEGQLRETVRAFLERLEQAPPDTAVVIYLAGRALQYEGENIFLPVGARLERESDAPMRGLRLSDVAHALAETPPGVKLLLVDSSGTTPPFRNGRNPTPGLAIMEPPENGAIGFSTAPDAIAPEAAPPYGAYAKALAEMMRLPGLGIDDFLAKVRLRVHEDTRGQQTPWDAVNLRTHDFSFFVPQANVAVPPAPQTIARLEGRSLRDYSPADAYAIVIERDRIADYQDFLRIYPDDPLARRIKALLAQRREALLWRKAVARNNSASYWTYLRTYPQGSFVIEARRRLARLQAPPVPPEDFVPLVYEDVPPPLADIEIVEPGYAFGSWRDLPPPPPPPVYILPPPEPDFAVLAPPPPRAAPYILPVPVFINRPRWARPPAPRPAPPPVRASVPSGGAQPQSLQPAPQQPRMQPQPSVSPQAITPPQANPAPANRREFRQMLQQRQQQLQTQQGRPVTPVQRRELRQQLRQEQMRTLQQQRATQPPASQPQMQRAQPAPAPATTDPRQPRQQDLQRQREQQIQQRQQQIQQRQQDMQQQRQQQMQQRQQEVQQQRQQQMQQRQQEMQQQRQQQIQQRQQQIQQQRQRPPACGQPHQPPCPH